MSKIQKELVELLEIKESDFNDRQEFLDEILNLMADADIVDDKTFKGLSKATKKWYNSTVDLLENNPKEDIPDFPDYTEEEEEDKPRRSRRRGRDEDEDEDEKPAKKSSKSKKTDEDGEEEIPASDCEVDGIYLVEDADEKMVEAVCLSVAKRVVKFETVKGEEEVCLNPKSKVVVVPEKEEDEDEKPAKRSRKSKKADEDEKPAKRSRKSKKADEDEEDEKPAKTRGKRSKGKDKGVRKSQMPDSIFSVVGALFCENPEITAGEIIDKLEEEGHDFGKDSVYVYLCTLKKSYDIFRENGLID